MNKTSEPGIQRNDHLDLSQNFLSQARELLSESSMTGVIKNYSNMLSSYFKVNKFSCLRVQSRGGRMTFQALDMASERESYTAVSGFSREFLQNFQDLYTKEIKSKKSPGEQYKKIVCDDVKVECTLLGHPSKGALLCLWNEINPEKKLELDYCVSLLAHEASWHRKLDNSQALLYIDELTGLFNYRYLDIALDSELRRASRYQQNFSILFIDLDDFKQVNDRYGHLVGSGILKHFGGLLQEELREVDTILRYGGDEYVVVLIGASLETGRLVAERIRRRVAGQDFKVQGVHVKLTCSLGVACFPEHGKKKEDLLRMADESMYASKRRGKNQVVTMDPLESTGRHPEFIPFA